MNKRLKIEVPVESLDEAMQKIKIMQKALEEVFEICDSTPEPNSHNTITIHDLNEAINDIYEICDNVKHELNF